jgi:hypothetical protein
MAPWRRLAVFVDAYEAGVRFTSDHLRALAGGAPVEPLRTLATLSADLTRDVGAAQVSAARWLLDA